MKSQSVGLLAGPAPARVRYAPTVRQNSWEDVSDLCAAYGLELDPWQEDVLRAALGERSDGRWAARQVGLSTPRQNGKTMVIVARVLAGLLLFGEKIIIVSAHRQDTARETFSRLVDIIEDNPDLKELVSFIGRSEMREYIRMKSGQEVRFKARSGPQGRGFSCDCLMLDEAQDLKEAAWQTIVPTMSARPNPQVWLLGTPPTVLDNGEVFGRIRAAGIEGKASQLAYLEWSAAPGDPPDDPETWAKANPTFGTRISFEAVQAEHDMMTPVQFGMERLGMWDDAGAALSVVSLDEWRTLAGDGPDEGVSPAAFGVAAYSGQFSVVGCWVDGEGRHVEEVFAHPRMDVVTDWLLERCTRRTPIFVSSYGAAAPLVPMLTGARLAAHSASMADVARGCELIVEGCQSGLLTHGGQAQLTESMVSARKKLYRDGESWTFDLKSSEANAPAMATALALSAAAGSRRPRPQTKMRRQGMVVLA